MIGTKQFFNRTSAPYRTLLAASLCSWLLLFALPFVNGPINNGTDWVQLCTQSGLKLVPIETNTGTAPASVHSLDCPCLAHSLQTVEHQLCLPTQQSLTSGSTSVVNLSLPAPYLLPPLRAPPIV